MWSVPDFTLRRQIKRTEWQTAIAFSGDSPLFAYSEIPTDGTNRRSFGKMRLDREIENQIPMPVICDQSQDPIRSIQRLWTGNRLAYCAGSELRIIDSVSGENKCSASLRRASVLADAVAVNKEGSRLVCLNGRHGGRSPHMNQGVVLWNLADDKEIASWIWPNCVRTGLRCAVFSPNSDIVAIGQGPQEVDGKTLHGSVHILDLRDRAEKK